MSAEFKNQSPNHQKSHMQKQYWGLFSKSARTRDKGHDGWRFTFDYWVLGSCSQCKSAGSNVFGCVWAFQVNCSGKFRRFKNELKSIKNCVNPSFKSLWYRVNNSTNLRNSFLNFLHLRCIQNLNPYLENLRPSFSAVNTWILYLTATSGHPRRMLETFSAAHPLPSEHPKDSGTCVITVQIWLSSPRHIQI